MASIWHENMLGYLSADMICSELRTEDIVLILLSFKFFRNARSFEYSRILNYSNSADVYLSVCHINVGPAWVKRTVTSLVI